MPTAIMNRCGPAMPTEIKSCQLRYCVFHCLARRGEEKEEEDEEDEEEEEEEKTHLIKSNKPHLAGGE